jgi:ATP synthase protein I
MTGEKGRGSGLESARKEQDSAVSGARFAGAGFQFAAIVISSAFAGIWLDRKVGTSPWLLIVTVFLGAALGFYSMYRNLMNAQRLGDRRNPSDRRDSSA